ncbi:hypothetical protein V5O48_013505 [Marasmius crinis-equi]|uniref:C6 transcription factor n=1 Tax=Marasmius crinis-equi TaxID=585013 RepID=A0ABR3EZZ3_9AGAR
MHALLAVAAQHTHLLLGLNSANADLDYHGLAVAHKNHVLQSLPAVTDPDIHLLLISFLCVLEYADTSGRDIFSLISTFFSSFHGRFFIGKPSTSIGLYDRRHPGQPLKINIRHTTESDRQLQFLFPKSLHHIHLPASEYAWPDPEEVQDPAISEAYREAVEALHGSWHLFQRQGSEMAAAVSWFARFTEEFYHFLVVERKQRALVLLYHYCTMLNWLVERDPPCWWASGQTGLASYLGSVWSLLEERWRMRINMATTLDLQIQLPPVEESPTAAFLL